MSKNPLLQLQAFGQSIWLDFLRRGMMASGELQQLIEEDGLRGVTANPSIFEKAIAGSHDYDDAVRALDIEIRVGLHTGEVDVRGDDLAGIAVHISARVQAIAEPGEVLVTSTVKDLVFGSSTSFSDRGEHDLRGVPGAWRLYAVES